MIPPRADGIILAGCLAVAGLCAVAIRLLARPTSLLSRWVDGQVAAAVTLPEVTR